MRAGAGAIPNGWADAALADLALIDIGFAFKSAEYSETGIRLLRGENIEPGRLRWGDTRYWPPSKVLPTRHFVVEAGDVILAMDRPVISGGLKLARATAADCPCLLVQRVARIRGQQGTTDLLYYALSSPPFVRHVLVGGQTGTQLPHVSGSRISSFGLRVPPFQEQRRMTEALDSYLTRLDAAADGLRRVEANLKRYRASVLKAAVEGRLVPTEAELAGKAARDYEPATVLLARILKERRRRWEASEMDRRALKGDVPENDSWKAKYQEPAAPDTASLPALPEGWCWATLPQLGELNRGKSKHRPRDDARLYGGSYAFVQTGDVRRADGFLSEFSQTYSEEGLKQSRLWPAGTLCITIAANIAETAILTFDACFPDSIVGFVSHGGTVLARFVEYFIRTAKQDLNRYAPATAQKNINLETLSAVAVPLPPASEQERIVQQLETLMSVGAHVSKSGREGGARVSRLRQSILKWAFEGKLVDQDPNDEPASVLLDRVRQERGAAVTAVKRPSRAPARKTA